MSYSCAVCVCVRVSVPSLHITALSCQFALQNKEMFTRTKLKPLTDCGENLAVYSVYWRSIYACHLCTL